MAGSGLCQSLTIHFTDIRNNKGFIQLQFYTSKQNFEKEKALFTRLISKSTLKNGSLTITYTDIPPGTYGIAILDDENSNTKMDYGLMLPEEGFGFSDYYHTGFKHPDFDRFKFNYVMGQNKRITIKLRYL